MSFLIIAGIVFGGLFLTAFLTKRRVGLLGMALASGSLLAGLWVGSLTPLVAQAGVEIVRPPLSSLVATVLVLLPAVLLFFQGNSVKSVLWRIVHSLVFATLAIGFLLEPMSAALVVDERAKPVFDFLTQYRTLIITGGIILSVVDLMFSRKRRHEKPTHH